MASPTIRDVARHAGVSVATVSRVLNDSPLVVEPTRARVRAAVEELGYRPNATARNLSIGRVQAIGVVVPFLTAPSVVERLRGFVERLGRRGYDLLLSDVEAPEQRADAMRDLGPPRPRRGLLVISLPVRRRGGRGARARGFAGRARSTWRIRGCRASSSTTSAAGRSPPSICSREVTGGSGSSGTIPPTPTASPRAKIAGAGSAPRWSARASSRSSAWGRTGAWRRARLPRPCCGSRTRRARSSPPPICRPLASCKPRSGWRARADDVAVIGFDDVDLAEIVGLTRSASRCAKAARWPPTCCWRR